MQGTLGDFQGRAVLFSDTTGAFELEKVKHAVSWWFRLFFHWL